LLTLHFLEFILTIFANRIRFSITSKELWNARLFLVYILWFFLKILSTWIECCLAVLFLTSFIYILRINYLIFLKCWCVYLYFFLLIELECVSFFVACTMKSWSNTLLSCKLTHFFCWNCSFSLRGWSSIHIACLCFYIWFSTRWRFIIRNSSFFSSRSVLSTTATILSEIAIFKLYLLAYARKLFRGKLFFQAHKLIRFLIIFQKFKKHLWKIFYVFFGILSVLLKLLRKRIGILNNFLS